MLAPEEVLVVANKKAARSVGLAKFYMQKRSIPGKNLLQVWVTDKESCSRKEYAKDLAQPVRRYLTEKQKGKNIRCILLFYGIPLKVAGPPVSKEEQELLNSLREKKDKLTKSLVPAKEEERKDIEKELKRLTQRIKREEFALNRSSSVDSELALVLAKGHSLSWWLPNPYFIGSQDKELFIPKKDVLMVSRLDGPDSQTVKRVILDSLNAEKEGLRGTAYFDARWPEPEDKEQSGYAFYDLSIHRAAKVVKEQKGLKVVLDDKGRLFQPGECPQAALYCGWYKLAHYVDAFEWQTGAVGYHIASSECATLKGKSQVWCKRMLEKGVAATLGPVGEPYVQSFPVPEVFFSFLLDGYYSLAEAYLLANPFWSWKMVLIGDPLYRPFGNMQ